MPIFKLYKEHVFPPVQLAEPDGLLATGGDLSPGRLLTAYRSGIFPWYEGENILWWCPDPRFVLFPHNLKVSKSMAALIKQQAFVFTIDHAFEQVISQCKQVFRAGQAGTWITDEVEEAFTALHKAGYAHSAEAWLNDQLVGGLYGIRLGKVFFGESMFTKVSNASKYVFIKYVQQLQHEGVGLIDCQVYTDHLKSLGAGMITRNQFIRLLSQLSDQ